MDGIETSTLVGGGFYLFFSPLRNILYKIRIKTIPLENKKDKIKNHTLLNNLFKLEKRKKDCNYKKAMVKLK